MRALASHEIMALEHSCRGNLESICVTSNGERLGKLLDILKASVKAAWLCHSSVSCSEHLNLVIVVWTTMEFLGRYFLPSKEMVVELPLLSYLPLLFSSTLFSDGFMELPLPVMWFLPKLWDLCANG